MYDKFLLSTHFVDTFYCSRGNITIALGLKVMWLLGFHSSFIYPQQIHDIQQFLLVLRMSSDMSLDTILVCV